MLCVVKGGGGSLFLTNITSCITVILRHYFMYYWLKSMVEFRLKYLKIYLCLPGDHEMVQFPLHNTKTLFKLDFFYCLPLTKLVNCILDHCSKLCSSLLNHILDHFIKLCSSLLNYILDNFSKLCSSLLNYILDHFIKLCSSLLNYILDHFSKLCSSLLNYILDPCSKLCSSY